MPLFEPLEPRVLLAGPDPMVNLGVGGGGGMFQVTVSPYDSQYVLIACDMSGDYRSIDGGGTWQMINYKQISSSSSLRPAFTSLKTYWADDGESVAANNMLKVSTDKGLTWSNVLSGAAPWSSAITDIAAISGSPDKLFVGTSGGLWQSQNGGSTWTNVSTTACNDIAVVGNTVYAALGTTLLRSTNGGVNWSTLTITGVSGATISSVAAVQVGANPVTVYAIAASNGTYRSTDGGTNWTRIHTWNSQTDVQVPAGQTARIYEAQEGSTVVYGTTNSGSTWSSIFRMGTGGNVNRTWIQTQLYWGYYITSGGLGVAPSDGNILYLATQGELYKSTDGGATWNGDMAIDLSGNRHQSIGLEVTTNWDYKWDPNNHDVQFICYTDVGFARSTDGGQTFAWSNSGNPWGNTMYEIAFDPFTPNKIYGAASNLHDIPEWNSVGNNSGSAGGVVVSTNGGQTWARLGTGLPTEPCTDIMVDPSSTPGAITLYATMYYSGVWKSTDGGAAWVQKSTGIGYGANKHAYHITTDPAGNLYVLVTGLRVNSAFNDHGGVWKSTNGGDSWTDITGGQWAWPTDVAVVDANTIYVAVAAAPGYAQACLWKTTNGGTTWTRVLNESQIAYWHTPSYSHALNVKVYPDNPNIVYCGTADHGLWVSLDAGATWSPFPNLPFQAVTNVAFDPQDHTTMYVDTFGGGVWKGFYLPLLPGDANRDGIVDMTDYVAWFSYFGQTGSVSWANGDFNGDRIVDMADYVLWFGHFGAGGTSLAESPAVSDAQARPAAAEPEPAQAAADAAPLTAHAARPGISVETRVNSEEGGTGTLGGSSLSSVSYRPSWVLARNSDARDHGARPHRAAIMRLGASRGEANGEIEDALELAGLRVGLRAVLSHR